ncbi:MAG: cytochrome c oxidase subunit 3 [Pseudomonadota bacterium]
MTASVQENAVPRLPAEQGVWMFVLGDLLVFALFFATYLGYRAESTVQYAQAQTSLNLALGTANTVCLLTSSWLMASAVKVARERSALQAKPAIVVALLFGVLFLVGKITEYVQKGSSGIGAEETEFFMFYFVFTGIHFVHVLIGIVLLGVLAYSLKTPQISERHLGLLEGGGVYWHMVDLLWIMLFTLFYLIH